MPLEIHVGDFDPEPGAWTPSAAVSVARMRIWERYGDQQAITNDELLALCQEETAGDGYYSSNPDAPIGWPEGCSPYGMGRAIDYDVPGGDGFSPMSGYPDDGHCENWTRRPTVNDTSDQEQAYIINQQCYYMTTRGFPFAVPLYGWADMWGLIFSIETNAYDANGNWVDPYEDSTYTTPCNLKRVVLYQGLATEQLSYAGQAGSSGTHYILAGTWKDIYYKTMQTEDGSGNSTPDMDGDPYVGRWVTVLDPGPNDTEAARLVEPVEYANPPGILHAGEYMSRRLARERVLEALAAADFDETPHVWDAALASFPGKARFVRGTTLAGEQDNVFQVPLLHADGMVAAMVILDDEDGHVKMVKVPTEPYPWTPITFDEARWLARKHAAHGESVSGDGKLYYAPRASEPELRWPYMPHYRMELNERRSGRFETLRISLAGEVFAR